MEQRGYIPVLKVLPQMSQPALALHNHLDESTSEDPGIMWSQLPCHKAYALGEILNVRSLLSTDLKDSLLLHSIDV